VTDHEPTPLFNYELTFESSVYGDDALDLHDPAELYHEASKFYPSLIERQADGVVRLEADPLLQSASCRSVKRHPQLPRMSLPKPDLPAAGLGDVLRARRSARDYASAELPLTMLSTLLATGYGITEAGFGGLELRTVPSGGGLFPLEIYVAAVRVTDLAAGIYHYDPLAHQLEQIEQIDEIGRTLAEATYAPTRLDPAAALFISAMFWRSRFKYGLRAYRFTLFEAGHVAQNVLLAAAALRLAALPLGSFYDRLIDDLLGLDGVNESVLYPILAGLPADERDGGR
jgi:SagB-type dehydrogenase family enzyme